ncbi:MAG: Error-prone repair protein ImuA [Chitinophagaceae bacterium]
MLESKAHIIAQLQRELLLLQGFKPASNAASPDAGLGAIQQAFPNNTFPLGAIHEFSCTGAEEASASSGFIAGVLSSLMQRGAVSLWISASRTLFPPALQLFGIAPHRVIFIDLKREADLLWAVEEALKCKGLASVVAEIKELSFTASRRLQLAVEQSGVTGFILRRNPCNAATASVTKWKITPASSEPHELPGLGFPRWNVALLKVRNGKPGTWQMEWVAGKFQSVHRTAAIIPGQFQRQTG